MYAYSILHELASTLSKYGGHARLRLRFIASPQCLSWSPDGFMLVVTTSSDELVFIDTRKMRKQRQWSMTGHMKVGGWEGGREGGRGEEGRARMPGCRGHGKASGGS